MTSIPTFSLKTLLVKLLGHPRATQLLKWLVYGALSLNCLLYFVDDFRAVQVSLPPGAPLDQILEKFSTTVDTAAWLGLVFIFEMETYIISEATQKSWIGRSLVLIRILCYVLIAMATYGYLTDVLDYRSAEPVAGLHDLCTVSDQQVAVQTNSINYVEITPENCQSLSTESTFFRLPGEVSLLDSSALAHVTFFALLNLVNAFVWLLVVFLIEIEIRLQLGEKFGSATQVYVGQASTVLYGILITVALIWLFSGYPLYTWDAVLWIAGFWAIELNLAEWEQEHLTENAGSHLSSQ